jgi:hypothetical protein
MQTNWQNCFVYPDHQYFGKQKDINNKICSYPKIHFLVGGTDRKGRNFNSFDCGAQEWLFL